MIVRITSLAYTPGAEPPVHVDAADLQRVERQALRRQHVAHLRGADAERDGAERAVRRRVAVAAGDRHARLRQPELGPDHVHDALVLAARTAGRPELNAERRGSCARAPTVISSAVTSRNGRVCALVGTM